MTIFGGGGGGGGGGAGGGGGGGGGGAGWVWPQLTDEQLRVLTLATVDKASAIQDSKTDALESLPAEQRVANARADEAEQANKLRKLFSRTLLGLMMVQITGADVVFVIYTSHVHWVIPAATMNVWLSSVVVQVIGTVGIVVHYLFPRHDGK